MRPNLKLSRVTANDLDGAGAFAIAMTRMRDELSQQLLGSKTVRPFLFVITPDDGAYGAPAWTDPGPGVVHIARDTLVGLQRGDLSAIAALGHQLIHAIGDGPAFPDVDAQFLEEAITETLLQAFLAAFAEAFDANLREVAVLGPLLRPLPELGDLEVARITATSVSVERFARIAAWVGGFDGEASADELEEIAIWWALRLKVLHAADRFAALAEAGASQNTRVPEEIPDAALWLENYLRGYMKTLERSRVGFAGLEYAGDRAFGDESKRPVPQDRPASSADLKLIESIEAVTLRPLPHPGEVNAALQAAEASPAVDEAAHRSLDVRMLLWAARTIAQQPQHQ
jgi:hypothetical protein